MFIAVEYAKVESNDAEARRQGRVLVLCGVGAWHDDVVVVVVFVAPDVGRWDP